MNNKEDRAKRPPADVTEDEIQQVAQGRSEEIVGGRLEKSRPMDLNEDEVRYASEGRSEAIRARKQSSD